mgnify:CR=1 FL=1|jgi:hypothetical protein
MALGSIKDAFRKAFIDKSPTETEIRTSSTDAFAGKYFDLTEPDTVTEIITWYTDSGKATLFATTTIIYTSASKRTILSFDEVLV